MRAAACYDGLLRIGIHTSIAGSLENAALRAADLGANTFQIFSSSPRSWRASTPDPVEIKRFKAARERLGLAPLVIHSNYLVNLAAEDPALRSRSVESFRGEIARAAAIGAEYLVLHPGSYGGQGIERGICAVIESLRQAGHGLHTRELTILFENTAGGGTKLGGTFEELRVLRELAARFVATPTGVCLDTCHLFASGYDVSTPEGLRRTVREADAAFGIASVYVIHVNDSKTPLGSHCDRHTHIGRGHIGADGFRRILNHPKLRAKPFILETPRDEDGDERRNVEMLKSLCRRKLTTIRRSS